jgi:lysophospholipase L1-like esterase
MFECLILGDSIAVGTHRARLECVAYARSGINSQQFNKQYPGEFFANSVVISLGTNDHKFVKTEQELENLRKRIVAKGRVIWILPSSKPEISSIVSNVAEKYGDMVLAPHPQYMSKDGIHPTGTGYRWLASFTEAFGSNK